MTGVGLLTRVNSVVLSEVHALVVAFATFLTPEWFLPSVDSPMLNEVCTLDEAFPTFVTFMRPLSWRGLLVDIAEFLAVCPL